MLRGSSAAKKQQLQESISTALQNCIEINSPESTRETIRSLLVAESMPGILDLICALLEELCIVVLNQKNKKKKTKRISKQMSAGVENESSDSKPIISPKQFVPGRQRLESPKGRSSQQQSPMQTLVNSNNTTPLARSTKFGTVALPKVLEDFDMPKSITKSSSRRTSRSRESTDVSASDIPSQSSESSNDAQSADNNAVEAEWGLHLSSAPQPPSRQDEFPSILGQVHAPTHADFVNSIVNDIEQLESQQQPKADSLDDEHIFIAIWTALSADDDGNNMCTSETLSQLSRSLVHRLGLGQAFGERLEEVLAVRLTAFTGCPVNSESCALIAQVVRITVQQLSRDQGQSVRPAPTPRKTFENVENIESASNLEENDEFDVIPRSSGKKKVGVTVPLSAGTPMKEKTPKPKPHSGDAEVTPSGDGPYLPETPPAWLIPKSPLDSVFRKRFGGLGDPELTEVISNLEVQEWNADAATGGQGADLDDDSIVSPSLSSDSSEDNIGVDDLPQDFGWSKNISDRNPPIPAEMQQASLTNGTEDSPWNDKISKPSPKSSSNRSPATRSSKKRDENTFFEHEISGKDDVEVVASEEIDPASHPSMSLQKKLDGSLKLTNNESLNRMLMESFQGFVQQYAHQGDKLQSLKEESHAQSQSQSSPSSLRNRRSKSPSPSPSPPKLAKEYQSRLSKSSKGSKAIGKRSSEDSVDYESYERLMQATIRKTNELIQTNSRNLRSLALAVEEEERQRGLVYPDTHSHSKSRSDSYLYLPSGAGALSPSVLRSSYSSGGSGSKHLRVSRSGDFTDGGYNRKVSSPTASNSKLSTRGAKETATHLRHRSNGTSIDSEEDQEGHAEDDTKLDKKLKKFSKKKSKSDNPKSDRKSPSPTKSLLRPTVSTSLRSLDKDQIDIPGYPYSYPTSLPHGVVPPLGLWSDSLHSRQNKLGIEKMLKKMKLAGQLHSRNSTNSSSSIYNTSNGSSAKTSSSGTGSRSKKK